MMRVVPGALELLREFRSAFFDDASLDEHVYFVGLHVVEDALVMRDEQDRVLGRALCFDAFGDDAQRIDVEPRVGLVQDRERGLQHEHLQHFEALFLTAGKTVVDVAAQHLRIHS